MPKIKPETVLFSYLDLLPSRPTPTPYTFHLSFISLRFSPLYLNTRTWSLQESCNLSSNRIHLPPIACESLLEATQSGTRRTSPYNLSLTFSPCGADILSAFELTLGPLRVLTTSLKVTQILYGIVYDMQRLSTQ